MFDSDSFDTQSFSEVSFDFGVVTPVDSHVIASNERLFIDKQENRIYCDEP